MTIEISQDAMSELSNLVSVTLDLQREVDQDETRLAEKQARLKHLVEVDIPTAMEACGGMETLTTRDGWKIEIKRDFAAHISESNHVEAMQWLIDNDFEDLIKHDVSVSFSRGENETAEELRDRLSAEGFAVKDKETVHAQTLKAFVREQKEQGANIPDELFGVYPVTKAKITKGK